MRRFKFALSTLSLIADVVRSILTTRVALGTIALVLLNQIKRFIFVMFKLLPQMFTQLIFIFLFSSPITTASRLNFRCLAISVWLVCWYVFSMGKKFIYGTFEDCIGLCNSCYCCSYFRIWYIRLWYLRKNVYEKNVHSSAVKHKIQEIFL